VPLRAGRNEPRAIKRRPKPYQHLTKPHCRFKGASTPQPLQQESNHEKPCSYLSAIQGLTSLAELHVRRLP
jgi:hypothetical protein